MKTYKYAARPLADQRATMLNWLVLCCRLYNNCLEQRILWWKRHRKGISFYDQNRQLTELRNDPDAGEWASLPVTIARSALQRLQKAYEDFFRRCKAGETPGHPRFRKSSRYKSFGIGRATVKMGKGDKEAFVRVPKGGWLRFKMHRPIEGKILNVEVKLDHKGRWFVCIACDIGLGPMKCMVEPERAVGVDVGLTAFATLHTGEKIENPRFLRIAAEGLARAQRALALKPKVPGRRDSKSRERARKAVARACARVANARLNFHFHVAGMLVKRWDLICFEALRICSMVHGNLAKSILDAGWGQLIAITTYKAEWAGKHVITVDPRGTTQECSSCGAVVPKGLGDRVHVCLCGCVLDRDHNAGLNIVARGLRAVPEQFRLLGPEPQSPSVF